MLVRKTAIALIATLSIASIASASTIFHVGLNTTVTVSDEGLAAASALEAAFLASLTGDVTTEAFEGFAAGFLSPVISTSVGDFSQLLAGSTGSCEVVGCDALLIDSLVTDPAYVGRFPIDGENWLDSNDSMESRWQRTGDAPTSLGFYITDPNDQGARIDLTGFDTLEDFILITDLFGQELPSGAVFYMTVSDPDGIESIDFIQTDPADGFGIDRFTIAVPGESVPEPTTIGLLGLGLLALYRGSRKARTRS